MRPADRAFGDAREVILRLAKGRAVGIEWVPSRTLVVDNWRTLHARSASPTNDADRLLERILVVAS
jgi:alpha-ketoglutarate-dependent taurine dioxygenase